MLHVVRMDKHALGMSKIVRLATRFALGHKEGDAVSQDTTA